MSGQTSTPALADVVASYGSSAALLTVGDDLRPHSTMVTVEIDGAVASCGVGSKTVRNAGARPRVSLFWSPPNPGDYSLILDGDAAVDASAGDDRRVLVTITRAVLHRPAAATTDAGGCGSDCVNIAVPQTNTT